MTAAAAAGGHHQQPPPAHMPHYSNRPPSSAGHFGSNSFGVTAGDLLAAAALAGPSLSPRGDRDSPSDVAAALTSPPQSSVVVGSGDTAASPLPQSREQLNSQIIEEAGVGPMAPLEVASTPSPVTAANDKKSSGGGGRAHDQGSTGSTEEDDDTSPEGDNDEDEEEEEEDDDSITRCICDYLHDDGYMICCDKCS